ncbi:MAG: hypothetical protein A2408_00905 [Candidatus Yonathbacteria bacterium RIFOXYC1_FULL_52_10]|uniref:Uncharacterized protein n=1 Tax=Candidatus Yonathbacteria bacterium RIFOXYD1_FULL_52_36 TaxID=1802730 RepID=A0A1G2SMM5_9BACT|nr:MAG: hypothetical protein A2408_00905 [Candidatus Yonathbacteria bacterium RIFOXYC1_FULL_52_10]OHA86353.1 MAG: hypothetical protein A2591_02535 [Candidatus Yonathbacteria bacterium RIFOXYD1_FULL_52_36]
MEVALSLKFSDEERQRMGPSFAFGDAEEQLSYAVHLFGSEQTAVMIVESNNADIGVLALEEVDGFDKVDIERIGEMIGRHGRKLDVYKCSHCQRERYSEVNLRFCPRCLHPGGFVKISPATP